MGISAFYHDSGVTLLRNGEIVAAAQEERFSRIKHDKSFPEKALQYVLDEACITLKDVSKVVYYEKPFLKFERLLETYHAFAPAGLESFVTSMPVWLKEKLFMKKELREVLSQFVDNVKELPELLFAEHHLSHMGSAFFPSPYEKAAILTIDGVGEWATTTIGYGSGNEIAVKKEIRFPHSLGLFYSAVTAYCGFKVNSGEYKLMGLAPYGDGESEETLFYERQMREHLIQIKDDGSYILNMNYFQYATGLRMYHQKRWQELFKLPPRPRESEELSQAYMNFACAAQKITEDVVLKLAKTAKKLTAADNLCLAGGVALNCVANGKLIREKIFSNVWVQPASGDAGGSLGAALAAYYVYSGGKRKVNKPDSMQGAYLGPAFSDRQIVNVAHKFEAPHTYYENFSELVPVVAELLSKGSVIGWFQGRMEFGPRALGNRSILGDARNLEMQKKMNLKIKYREGFRPFAPSIQKERMLDYFDLDGESPYMLVVTGVQDSQLKELPVDYKSLPLYDRLYIQRSSVQAVTHVDNSARVQTVSRETNSRYWELLEELYRQEDCPLVVNTSFNVRGEPIVCTPDDAYMCFMRTEMDYLVMGNCLFAKSEQSPLADDKNWLEEFELD